MSYIQGYRRTDNQIPYLDYVLRVNSGREWGEQPNNNLRRNQCCCQGIGLSLIRPTSISSSILPSHGQSNDFDKGCGKMEELPRNTQSEVNTSSTSTRSSRKSQQDGEVTQEKQPKSNDLSSGHESMSAMPSNCTEPSIQDNKLGVDPKVQEFTESNLKRKRNVSAAVVADLLVIAAEL